MKRWLFAAALATLCISLTAGASWSGLQLPGRPVDAEIQSADGGFFAIATSAGAFEVKNGAVTRSVNDAGVAFVNATIDSTNCLVGTTVRQGTNAKFISSCTGVAVRNTGAQDLFVMRHTPDGGAFATGKNSTGNAWVAWYDPSPNTFTDAFVNPFVTPNDLLAALDLAGQQRVLYLDRANKKLSFSTQNLGSAKTGVDPALGDATELSYYFAGPQNPVALIAANVTANSPSALYQCDVDAGSSLALAPVSLPAAVTSVTGVSFTLGTSPSPALADGFGICAAKTATGEFLLRARPSPNNQGQDWMLQPLPPELDGGLTRVICRDGLFCVALTDRDAGVNVYAYVNSAGPNLTNPASVALKSGQTVTVSVSADDPDQDPVFSSAGSLSGATGAGLTLSKLDAGTWTVTAPEYCGPATTASFSADFTDGVHIPATANVQVALTPDEPAAVILSTDTVNLRAGDPAQTVTAQFGDGGCPVGAVVWSVISLGTTGLTLDGGALDRTFTPPLHLCSPGTAQLSVTAISDAGLSSSAVPLTVNVAPWGPPDPPFASPQTVLIDAGSAFTLTASQTHFCPAAPVQTIWASTAAPDSGISLNGLDTSVARTLDGGALNIQTSECLDSTVQLLAHNDTQGQVSGDVAVTVRSVPNIVAQNVGIGTLNAVVSDGGIVVTTAADYACAGALDYGVSLSLSRGVQSFGEQARFAFAPTPTTVNIPLPDCAGGTFTVTATLLKNDVATPIVRSVDVTAAAGDLPPPDVLVSEVNVSCDEGGSAQLSVVPKGSCPDLSYTWTSSTDLPVTISAEGDGSEATLKTVSTDVSDVIGRQARIQVTAISGGKPLVTTDVPIQFTTPAIVKLTHSTDTPIASDTELFGVEVTLHNKLACDLHGVDLVESLSSMTVVPESVRVNGTPVDASNVDVTSKLRINGIDVPASGNARVHFSGKPVIEGTPKPTGVAVFAVDTGDYRISDEAGFGREQDTNPPVCGCGEMGGLSMLALLSVTWLGRRRRARFPAT